MGTVPFAGAFRDSPHLADKKGAVPLGSEKANRRISNRRTAEGGSEDLESKIFTFAFCGSLFLPQGFGRREFAGQTTK
jgi:hypothetical protein